MNNNLLKRLISIIILLTATLIIIIVIKNNNSNINQTSYKGFYFDTYIEVTIYDSCDASIIDKLDKLCRSYDNMFSPENPQSDIYKINNTNEEINIDPETVYLVNEALKISQETLGKVDPTIYKVSKLWSFDKNESALPSEKDIKDALKNVNYSKISIINNTLTKGLDQEISLGFIAKGYIADQIAIFLKQNNIKNAIINLGGNVLCLGSPVNKDHYNIGIIKPFSDDSTPFCTINVKDKSVVTSGIYERYTTYNNKIYHHILNTKNGYPVENNIYSVTVIGDSSMICDALSTTLYILGFEDGIEFLNKYYPEYSCLYIFNDYSYTTSDNFNYNINLL